MSKLSVGVYGDSYANMNLNDPETFSWIDQLKTRHNVLNYGECGNSPYQCYKDYINNNSKHDYNIFVIPILQRFFSKYLFDLLSEHQVFKNWFINPDCIRAAKKDLLHQVDPDTQAFKLKIMDSVEFASMFWLDYEYVTEANMALIDKIKNDKNLILIDTNHSKNKIGLTDVSLWELEQVGYKEKYLDKGLGLNSIDEENKLISQDARANHFSEENNLVLGNMLLEAISNNFTGELELSYTDFVKPSKPLEHYLKWRTYG